VIENQFVRMKNACGLISSRLFVVLPMPLTLASSCKGAEFSRNVDLSICQCLGSRVEIE